MEIIRCRYCGAPYVYRENLELHEKGCLKRPAASSVDRYILPVALQREWIGRRERLWAEGRRSYEWSAGLYLEDDLIVDRDYAVGLRGNESPFVELRKDLRPIGTVHSHKTMSGPFWDDMINWVYVTINQIPEDLRPLYIVTLPDDTFFTYMLPRPERVEEACRRAWAERDRIRAKVEAWKLGSKESAQINAHYGLIRTGETKIWRRPKLGIAGQYFYL